MNNQLKPGIAEKALNLAEKTLILCEEGISLDDALDRIRTDNISGTAADLIFNYYRNKTGISYIIAKFASKKNKKTPRKFSRILELAATQIFFQSGIEPEIACDIAVTVIKKKYGSKPAGFINAVLRRVASDSFEHHLKNASEQVKAGIPKTLYKRWQKEKPSFLKDAASLLKSKPDTTFRITGQIDKKKLKSIHCEQLHLPEWASGYHFYTTPFPSLLFEKEWLGNGDIYIQDPSTVMAASLYSSGNSDTVYDLCAAPGGKTLLIAEKMNRSGILAASDLSLRRQRRTAENIHTHNLNSFCHTITASAFAPPFRNESANLVFIDVPCSNTGVFRKRPDVLWNFSEKKLKELVNIQKKILNSAAKLVKPHGHIIYSTCSIEKEENSMQIENFIKEHPSFKIIKEKQLFPCEFYDGAYAALLEFQKS